MPSRALSKPLDSSLGIRTPRPRRGPMLLSAAAERRGTIIASFSKLLRRKRPCGDGGNEHPRRRIDEGIFEMSRTTRMHLPFDDWPAEDRIQWESAFKTGDPFDESGPGAHLAESTPRVQRESYARFLGFISTHRQDLMHLPPHARIDRLVVAAYVAWRRHFCGDVTVGNDIDHLRGALKLICPGVDWSWLLTITKRIAAAAPRRHPKYHLVTSDRLYALGLELMDGAITDAGAAKHMSKAHAFQYRDGLIIALRALIPLRRRTLVAMRIGSHLVKTGDLWGLDITAADTKNRRPLDYPIPTELSVRIDLYL